MRVTRSRWGLELMRRTGAVIATAAMTAAGLGAVAAPAYAQAPGGSGAVPSGATAPTPAAITAVETALSAAAPAGSSGGPVVIHSSWSVKPGGALEINGGRLTRLETLSLSAPPSSGALEVGKTEQLSASGVLGDGESASLAQAALVYTSSDPAVASVSTSGLVSANAPGVAQITASATLDGSTATSAPVVVEVPAPAPGTMSIQGKDTALPSPEVLATSGNYLYVGEAPAPGEVVLQILDVSNPTAPTPVGSWSAKASGAYPEGLAVAGGYAYISEGAAGLQIIDVSNPASPTLAAFVPAPSGNSDMGVQVVGQMAYVQNYYPGGVEEIDVADPSSPGVVRTISSVSLYGWSFAAGNGYLYGFDMALPGTPLGVWSETTGSLVGSFNLAQYPQYADGTSAPWNTGASRATMRLSGGYLYVSQNGASWQGVLVIDVGVPADPTLAGALTLAGNGYADSHHPGYDFTYLAGSGSTLYVGDEVTSELYSINVSDPASPQIEDSLAGYWPFAGMAMAASGSELYALNDLSGSNHLWSVATVMSTGPGAGSPSELLAPKALSVLQGRGAQLSGAVTDASGMPLVSDAVVWSSSDPSVASVSAAGALRGVSPGTATLTASYGGLSASTAVGVAAPVVPEVWGVPFSATGAAGSPQRLDVLTAQPSLIEIELPPGGSPQLWALWILTPEGMAGPVMINQARAWWAGQNKVYPGETVNLAGRGFLAPGVTPVSTAPATTPSTGPESPTGLAPVPVGPVGSPGSGAAGAGPKIGPVAQATRVALVDATTHVALPARVVSVGGPYGLSFRVPGGLVAGQSYTVAVTNGLGGALGWSTGLEDQMPFEAVAAPADPLHLGVAWAGAFQWSHRLNVRAFGAVGNGAADDTAAVQAAINKAEAEGGGVVYFPPGTYSISSLTLGSGVVLEGAGQSLSRLVYDGLLTPVITPTSVYQPSIAFISGSGSDIGLAHLSLISTAVVPMSLYGKDYTWPGGWVTMVSIDAVNPWTTPTTPVSSPTSAAEGFFVKNVTVDNAMGVGVAIGGKADALVEGSTIRATRQAIAVNQEVGYDTIEGNYAQTQSGQAILISVGNNAPGAPKYGLAQAGRFVWQTGNVLDGRASGSGTAGPSYVSYPAQAGAGGSNRVEDMGGQDHYIADNTSEGAFGAPWHNAGEAIIEQGGRPLSHGLVSSATSTTLTYAGAGWSPGALAGFTVLITGGTGLGEEETITANTADTVTLAQSWPITPDTTSVFNITVFEYHLVIYANNLQAMTNGMVLMLSAYESVIANNVTPHSSIEISDYGAAFGGAPVYFSVVSGNTVGAQNPHDNLNRANRSVIGTYQTYQGGFSSRPTILYGNEITDNTLVGPGTHLLPLYVSAWGQVGSAYNGISVALPGVPKSWPWALGTIIEDNTVHSELAGVWLNEADYATVLSGNDLSGNATAVNDTGGVRTVVLESGAVAPVVPEDFSGLVGAEGGAELTWRSPGATSDTLEGSSSQSGPFAVIANGLSAPDYYDAAAPAGEASYYEILASNSAGEVASQVFAAYPAAPVAAVVVLRGLASVPGMQFFYDGGSPPRDYFFPLRPGATVAANAEVLDQYGNPVSAQVSYVSEDPSVATVSTSGVLTGVAPGDAEVEVTSGAITDKVFVHVTQLQSVTLVAGPRTSLSVGQADWLRFYGQLTDGARSAFFNSGFPGAEVTATSSDPAVLEAQAIESPYSSAGNWWYGTIEALASGTATVTVTVTYNGVTVTSNAVTVTVTPPPG